MSSNTKHPTPPTPRHGLMRLLRAASMGLVLLGSLASGTATVTAQVNGGGLFSLPRTQDDLAELRKAQREIEDQVFDAAVERLHRLLIHGRAGVVPATGVDRFLGLRQAVRATLRDLPRAGIEAYERLVARQAGNLMRKPFVELRAEELDRLATSFPTAELGQRARLRLGDLALERGDGFAAQRHYRAAADADPSRPGLGVRRAAARAMASAGPRSDGDIAEQITALRPAPNLGAWPGYGGGGTGGRVMAPTVGRPTLISSYGINPRGFFANRYRQISFPIQPVGDLRGIYINDGISLWAIDPLRVGEDPLWPFHGPMVDLDMASFRDIAGSINPDTTLTAAFDEHVVVAPLMVRNDIVGARRTQTFKASIKIVQKITSRRLFAVERATGKLLWSHWDSRGGKISERFSGHDVCGAPLIQGDTIYVPTHDLTGAIAYYLAAYDLATGEPKWRTLICSSGQEVNMFGNARQEFAAAPLAIDEGVIYGASNLGVCFAANAEDGSVRWITGYETIPLPPTQLRNQRVRAVHFANNPPVIAHGVVVSTPLDSEFALGIDIDSGRTLWRLPRRAGSPEVEVRWCLGALGDEFIFTGFGVLAVGARPVRVDSTRPAIRVVASSQALGESRNYHIDQTPRGAVVGDRIYLNLTGNLVVLDRDGNLDSPLRTGFELQDLGNLMCADGFAVLAGPKQVSVYADVPRLLAQAEEVVRKRPDDASAHLRLATLTLATSTASDPPHRIRHALEVFDRGLRVAGRAGLGSGSTIHRGLADGRFILGRRLASRVSETDPRAGVELMRTCRDHAPTPEQWIRVQLDLVSALRQSDHIAAELDALQARFGHLEFRFPGAGSIPVAAYALWRSVPLVDATEAVKRCQSLLRTHAAVQFGRSGKLGPLASSHLSKLLETHGRGIYAGVESRAQAAFEAVEREDTLGLELIVRDFPHSMAAGHAIDALLEVAHERNDLATALRLFVRPTGGWSIANQLRLVEVAERSGNRGLAYALARRLSDRSGSQPVPGETTTIAAWFAARVVPQQPATPPLQEPVRVVAELRTPAVDAVLELQSVTRATGFVGSADDSPAGTDLPTFVQLDHGRLSGSELLGFLTTNPPSSLDQASMRIPLKRLQLETLHLCGDLVAVCEHSRIRGVEVRTGHTVWERDDGDRSLTSLGVHQGVLVLFSASPSGRDSGRVFGIEPVSGTVLYRRRLSANREGFAPVATPYGIWYWETGRQHRIHRIDPTTGSDAVTTELSSDALEFLGVSGRQRGLRIDLQSRVVPFDEFLVIPVTAEDPGHPARCLAIEPNGKIRWRWRGPLGNKIDLAARHGSRCAIITSGAASTLTLLDLHGQPVLERSLGARATIKNWRKDGAFTPDAPDVLVITDSPGSAPRLTCVSLIGPKPYFSRTIPNATRILDQPQVGPTTLALPIRSGGHRRHQQVSILALDLGAPMRRNLPSLPKERPRTFSTPRVTSHGTWLVVQSEDGIVWIGDTAAPPSHSNR